MMHRDVIVVGASAGGVEALRSLVAGLSADLPASVLVVLHVPRSSPSALPAILARTTSLSVRRATDGEQLRPGRIYVAPADHHLLVVDGRLRLSRGPSENGHRPAVDPLFRSAARARGPRVVGVVLSGSRDDGAAGLAAIARHGGVTVVQDPADALHSSMPQAATLHVTPDHILPASKIGAALSAIVREPLPPSTVVDMAELSDDVDLATEVAISEFAPITTDEVFDVPAGYGCPNCGGALFEINNQPTPRFRCRIGHAWSGDGLLGEQSATVETALWSALRALEEKAALGRQMAEGSERRGNGYSAQRYRSLAADAERAAATIRHLIEYGGPEANDALAAPALVEDG